jgi:copper chaperone
MTDRRGVTFAVEDMSCAHCVATITEVLRTSLPGAAIAVDLEHKRVTVDGDAARAAAIIRDAGYTPRSIAA